MLIIILLYSQIELVDRWLRKITKKNKATHNSIQMKFHYEYNHQRQANPHTYKSNKDMDKLDRE